MTAYNAAVGYNSARPYNGGEDDVASRPIPIDRHFARGKVPYGDEVVARALRLRKQREQAELASRVNRERQLMLDEEDALVALLLAD